MNITDIGMWISANLNSIQQGLIANTFEPTQIESSLAKSFISIGADLIEDGDSVETPHWNLLMADWNSNEDAVFVAAAFDERGTFLVGRAKKGDVLAICDELTLSETEEVVARLSSISESSEECVVDRRIAEHWLACNSTKS